MTPSAAGPGFSLAPGTAYISSAYFIASSLLCGGHRRRPALRAAADGGQVHGYYAHKAPRSTPPAAEFLPSLDAAPLWGSRYRPCSPYSGVMQRIGTAAWWPS